jgi:hypothetical protein
VDCLIPGTEGKVLQSAAQPGTAIPPIPWHRLRRSPIVAEAVPGELQGPAQRGARASCRPAGSSAFLLSMEPSDKEVRCEP